MDIPILYIMFNRPDSVKKSFPSIQSWKPKYLYIACDAARPQKLGEAEKVNACKNYIEQNITWPTELTKIYRQENLGCAKNISSAISQVLSKHSSLIILEDDCIPNSSFLPFMQEMLEKFKDDARIMSISGNNFQFQKQDDSYSYYFSRYHHCWGWGTWRRAWNFYDHSMSELDLFLNEHWIKEIFENSKQAEFWKKNFLAVKNGTLDSWNLRWTLSCWIESGLCVLPRENLVSNIGFDAEASRTTRKNKLANIPTVELAFPLKHPNFVIRNSKRDHRTQKLYHMNRIQIWKDRIFSLFRQID